MSPQEHSVASLAEKAKAAYYCLQSCAETQVCLLDWMGWVSFGVKALLERSFLWAWSLVFRAWTRGLGFSIFMCLRISMCLCICLYFISLSIYIYVCALHVCKYTQVWGCWYICVLNRDPRLMLGAFLYHPSTLFIETESPNRTPSLLILASQLALGILCLHLLRAGKMSVLPCLPGTYGGLVRLNSSYQDCMQLLCPLRHHYSPSIFTDEMLVSTELSH